MTLVYQRAVQGPELHALVLGVGAYPHAKPVNVTPATPPALADVPDLPSAAAGAALFADWLITHADRLPAPLASVELLISDPAEGAAGGGLYAWTQRPQFADALAAGGTDPRGGSTRVAPCTEAQVNQDGLAWAARLGANGHKSVTIVFVCGHGIAMPNRSLLLLEDLAGLPAAQQRSIWEPFLDVQLLASRLQRNNGVSNAYIFADACQEVLPGRLVAEADPTTSAGAGVRLLSPDQYGNILSNVLLLVPGSMGTLAFDDGVGEGGRYTHMLIQALTGAAAAELSGTGHWGVKVTDLSLAMQELNRLRWHDHDLEPVAAHTPTMGQVLVRFAPNAAPLVPVRVCLDPLYAAGDPGLNVSLVDPNDQLIAPWIGPEQVWLEWVEVRQGLCKVRSTRVPDTASDYVGRDSPVDLSARRLEPVVVHRVAP